MEKKSSEAGAVLLTVNATDEDKNENGRVLYRLDNSKLKNDDWRSFNIDQNSGVLTLKSKFNISQQSTYLIDIIAFDRGKPNPLQSRFTLVLIIVDEYNNSAQFNRMQICLSGILECERDYQSVIVRMREEIESSMNVVPLNLAKINDLSKKNDEICYYLLGPDKKFFKLNKKSAVLMPKDRLDREKREKYEIVIKSSEYCECVDENIYLKQNQSKNPCYFVSNQTFDFNDISLLKVKVIIQDINDNKPKFLKSYYQIGVTSDIEYGDIILDSYATDLDSTSSLSFNLIKSSLESNIDLNSFLDKHVKSHVFPFSIKYFEEKLKPQNDTQTRFKAYRFQIRTNLFIKEKNFHNNNVWFKFNVCVVDEKNNSDTSQVQIVLINKQQRVKLVFSQPIEKVYKFHEEFQGYISNLTGFKAFIDKIYVHKLDDFDENENIRYLANRHALTDMLLHFSCNDNQINTSNNSFEVRNCIINADKILNLLDRSADVDLLKKYKLSLAEKYDDHGSSTFYKYGTITDDDYSSFFSIDSNSTLNTNILTRLVLIVVCFLLLILLISTTIVFICMKKSFKRKLRAERAMIKAFGLDQRSITFNDTIGTGLGANCNAGYLNMAFDSNSLMPIPGTNLYAYEGSNPMWIKKYDKIEVKNNTSSSISSSCPSSSSSAFKNVIWTGGSSEKSIIKDKANKSEDEITSFYLKQIDSTPETSKCSPSSDPKNQENGDFKNKITVTNNKSKDESETLESYLSPNENKSSSCKKNTNTNKSISSSKNPFQTETLLTFASDEILNKNKLSSVKSLNNNSNSFIDGFKEELTDKTKKNNKLNSKDLNNFRTNFNHSSLLFQKNASSFTKIFDSTSVKREDNFLLINQPMNKDVSDLFAVESTVI